MPGTSDEGSYLSLAHKVGREILVGTAQCRTTGKDSHSFPGKTDVRCHPRARVVAVSELARVKGQQGPVAVTAAIPGGIIKCSRTLESGFLTYKADACLMIQPFLSWVFLQEK
jgi:hypothetical protein